MKLLIVTLTIVTLGLQYRLWVGDGSLAQVSRLQSEIIKQSAENDRLKTRNQLLAAEVDAFKIGTEGIEERARERMGMIKKGETFFMIVDETH
ncbi:MAG: cell division protein FtsB [Agarilytica sp.]